MHLKLNTISATKRLNNYYSRFLFANIQAHFTKIDAGDRCKRDITTQAGRLITNYTGVRTRGSDPAVCKGCGRR